MRGECAMRIASDYVHVLDGRLRIKVAEVKGCPRMARLVEEQLRSRAGITEVTANPTTGNVLVLHDATVVSHWDIAEDLRALGCLRRMQPTNRRRRVFVGHFAQTIARATVEVAVQRVVYALVSAV